MGKLVKFAIALFILCASTAWATSVTVCDSECDYTNIAAALTAVGSGTHTVTVTGTYTGAEDVSIATSGTDASNRLVLTATANQTIKSLVVGDNKDFITVNGFTITGLTTQYAAIVDIYKDCDYITLSNNLITASYVDVRGVRVGISGSGNLPTNITISGNTITDVRYDCFLLVYANTYTVSGNTFQNGTWGADAIRAGGTYGVYDGNTFHNIDNVESAYHADIIQVYGNTGYSANNIIFRNNLAYADSMALCQPCNLTSDNREDIHTLLFYNNIFVNIQYACSIYVPGVEWYNNVFVNSGWNTGAPVIFSIYTRILGDGDGKVYTCKATHTSTNDDRPPTGANWATYWQEDTVHTTGAVAWNVSTSYGVFAGAGDDGVFKNNVLIGTGTPDGTGENYGWPSAAAGVQNLTMSNNYVSKPSPGFGSKSGWNTSSGNINGGDPGFVNFATNDFRLTVGSILKDVGATIADFSTDKIGVVRPQGEAWDIGAYEYEETGGGTYPAIKLGTGAGFRLGTGAGFKIE